MAAGMTDMSNKRELAVNTIAMSNLSINWKITVTIEPRLPNATTNGSNSTMKALASVADITDPRGTDDRNSQ
jgi:hypothetical protein